MSFRPINFSRDLSIVFAPVGNVVTVPNELFYLRYFMKILSALSSIIAFIYSLSAFAFVASAVPIPLNSAGPIPLEKVRPDNPAVLSMTGEWKFQIAKGRQHDGQFIPEFDAVKASTEQGDHRAIDAFGENDSNYWSASNGKFPQSWQVDLGEPKAVQELKLQLEDKKNTYQGTIETSADGKAWKVLANLQTAAEATDGNLKIPSTKCRYIRVTFTNARNARGERSWPFIRHVQITILQDGKKVVWLPDNDVEGAVSKKFVQADFKDDAFKTIPVPANWEVEGFSIPTYDQPDDSVGLYRRNMKVPASFAGKQIVWHFDGVFDTAEVFINGRRAGYHESGFTAFDLDISDFVTAGATNTFAVRVCKNSDSVDLDTGDYWALGGIFRDNYLVAVPKTHLDDTSITTTLRNDYHDATLNAVVAIVGAPNDHVEVSAQLFQADGTKFNTPEMKQSAVIGQNGTTQLQFSQPAAAPKLWSAEKPNLYYLVTTLSSSGKILEQTQSRFGFKQIEIKGGVLLWNGTPIKLTGTCRHEEWAVSGHALTEQQWQTDVALMKAANINAVRTSHYIHAERFLDLCDEKGFYVLDEIPFCWADPRNESYGPPFVLRTNEAFARDKNRPCVLAWSMGNESGYGPANNAGFEQIKKLDPTRPAFISGAKLRDNHDLDLLDFHYPHVDEIKKIINNPDRQTKPAMLTEGPHTFYTTNTMDYDYGVKDFWGRGLLLQWNSLWPDDRMLGAFIWEWQDQGLADKFPDRTNVDSENLRSNNHKGFMDGYRNPLPDYFNVKMVYSPIVINERNFDIVDKTVTVKIHNRYSFTDLSELNCHWQAFDGNKLLAEGNKQVACSPRTEGVATFAAIEGMNVLRLEFIHPDKRSVYSTRLEASSLQYSVPDPVKSAAGEVRLQETGRKIDVSVGSSHLVFSKEAGGLESWKFGDQPLLTGNFILNLGVNREPMPRGGEDSKESLISKQLPKLKTIALAAKLEKGKAIIDVTDEVTLVEAPKSKGTLQITCIVSADGKINVNWHLNWSAETARVWELGLELPVNPLLNRMQWHRHGLWTEYPTDHIGATDGVAGPEMLTFRCTKRDVQWLTLSSSNEPAAICLSSDGTPLHARGKVANGDEILFASALNAPIEQDLGDGMFGEYFIFLRPNKTYAGSFDLQVVGR